MDQQAMGSKPRSYTEDYKRQIVDLVASSGRTATAVAADTPPCGRRGGRWDAAVSSA